MDRSGEKATVKSWLEIVRSRLPNGPVDPIYVSIRAEAVDSTEAERAIDAVLQKRRTAVGSALLPWYSDSTTLLRGLAAETLARSSGDFEAGFERAWTEWSQFVDDDTRDLAAIASVRGLWLADGRIQFDGDEFFLDQLPESLALERWAERSGLDGHALGFYCPFIGLPWSAVQLGGPEFIAQQDLLARVRTAWRALSLVTPTSAAFPLPDNDYLTVSGTSWIERPQGRMVFGGTTRAGMPIKLSTSTEAEWVQTYRQLRRLDMEQYAFLDLAFERFVEASRKRRHEDRIIDFSISAESLFLVGLKEELRNRLAQRGAVWLGGTAAQRDMHFKDWTAIYDARSTLVHGQRLSGKAKSLSADRLAEAAGTHMRSALKLAVDWCAAGRCLEPSRGLMDWDREFRQALVL